MRFKTGDDIVVSEGNTVFKSIYLKGGGHIHLVLIPEYLYKQGIGWDLTPDSRFCKFAKYGKFAWWVSTDQISPGYTLKDLVRDCK